MQTLAEERIISKHFKFRLVYYLTKTYDPSKKLQICKVDNLLAQKLWGNFCSICRF